jgi:TPR repeat protein
MQRQKMIFLFCFAVVVSIHIFSTDAAKAREYINNFQPIVGSAWRITNPSHTIMDEFHQLMVRHQSDHDDSTYYFEIFRWNRLAARQGDMTAQYNLGIMFRDGLGTLQNYEKAAEWFELSAKQGHDIAQYNLGVMYQDGIGVEQDYSNAMEWLHRSADQGNADAHFNIGAIYQFGKGVPINHRTAFKWYLISAEAGNPDAHFNLGLMYATGEGVKQDKVTAYMWLDIVAEKGDKEAARSWDALGKWMTAEEIKEAKELARECERIKFKDC